MGWGEIAKNPIFEVPLSEGLNLVKKHFPRHIVHINFLTSTVLEILPINSETHFMQIMFSMYFRSTLIMTDTRLCDDRSFVQNTLPYIIPYLSPKDLLNASKANALWESIICEYYFDKMFIPVCFKHKNKVIGELGSHIRRLHLTENNYADTVQQVNI